MYGESDPELITETLQQFKTEALGYVAQIGRLWRTGAFDDITRYVHSLKSMAAMVGAERMSGLCRVFERQLRSRDMIEAQRTYPLFETVWVETLDALDLYVQTEKGTSTDAPS